MFLCHGEYDLGDGRDIILLYPIFHLVIAFPVCCVSESFLIYDDVILGKWTKPNQDDWN